MGEQSWRDLVGDAELPPGVEECFDELERSGWYARSRWGDHSIRFWPDGGRRKQLAVDLRLPINEHRLQTIREAIAAHIDHIQKETEGGAR